MSIIYSDQVTVKYYVGNWASKVRPTHAQNAPDVSIGSTLGMVFEGPRFPKSTPCGLILKLPTVDDRNPASPYIHISICIYIYIYAYVLYYQNSFTFGICGRQGPHADASTESQSPRSCW